MQGSWQNDQMAPGAAGMHAGTLAHTKARTVGCCCWAGRGGEGVVAGACPRKGSCQGGSTQDAAIRGNGWMLQRACGSCISVNELRATMRVPVPDVLSVCMVRIFFRSLFFLWLSRSLGRWLSLSLSLARQECWGFVSEDACMHRAWRQKVARAPIPDLS